MNNKWISVKDTSVEIPFTKVCIYDGGNTFWGYLQTITIFNGGRKLTWDISGRPADYPDLEPTHWKQIDYPNNTNTKPRER